jgi:outer membrane protein assembly factor BamD
MRPASKWFCFWLTVFTLCVVLPQEAPAPLIWRKGEGWAFEKEGGPIANSPKEQLEIGRKYQEAKKYDEAITAYRRVITRWPTSFASQDARLGLAECLVEIDYLYKGFREYQNLIEKHPGSPHFETVLERQYEIGVRFLTGAKHRIWRFRVFNGLDKSVEVFEKVVKNGPYSKVGPKAQFGIGQAYERQKDNISAVRAYEKVLERYPKLPIAEEAQFQIGAAYQAEAQRAEYDQNNANQAIAAFTEFLVRYPQSARVEDAQNRRAGLKQEQSKGLFQIAEFYEKRQNPKAASIYYNEVIEQNPRSDWANQAQKKLTELAALTKRETATP